MKTNPFALSMLKNRFVLSVLAIAIGLGTSFIIPSAEKSATVVGGYQATTCPALGGGYSSVELTNTTVGIRPVTPKSTKLILHHQTFRQLNNSPLYVDSTFGSAYTLTSQGGGGGVAAALCQPGSAEQWFVGGSGGLTSTGVLEMVNSGFSPSTVEIHPYSSAASLPPVTVKIPANSENRLRVDALVPGDELMALDVITRSGRVTSFLFDQRNKGLRSLGMDYAAGSAAPATHIVIPVGLNPSTQNGKVANSLRLLVPGPLDATVTMQIVSADGAFTPVGFDSRKVARGKVIQLPINNLILTSPFSVVIDSDRPVVAGLFTQTPYGDFAWGAATTPFTRMALNMAGLQPTLVLTGSQFRVSVQMVLANGKRTTRELTGDSFLTWNPGGAVKSLALYSEGSKPVYGGLLIRSANGFTYLPVQSNTTPTQTLLPVTDVHTLTR